MTLTFAPWRFPEDILCSSPGSLDEAGRAAMVLLTAYPDWRDQFADALDTRTHTIEWLDGEVAAGRVRLFACRDAAVLAELRRYPTGATDLHFLLGVGLMEAMRDVLRPRAEAWAQSMGALGSVVESRSGWERALRSCGYEPFQTCLRKEFEPGSAGGEYRRFPSA
jgi:hypothetical protein